MAVRPRETTGVRKVPTTAPPIGYDPKVLTSEIKTVQDANEYVRAAEHQSTILERQKADARAKVDALIQEERANLGTVVRTEEGGPGVYLYKKGKGTYTPESFKKFQEDTQKFVEGTDKTIDQLKENISTIDRALKSVVVRPPTTVSAVPSAKQYFTVKDPRTGVAAKFTDRQDAIRYRDNLATELIMGKRARVGSEARQEWERMQEVASQSPQRVALAELVSEGIVTTGEGKEGSVSYQFKADPKKISQENIDLARTAGFDMHTFMGMPDIRQEFGGGVIGARKGKQTRNIALELFVDAAKFAGSIAQGPKNPLAGIKNLKESREYLGEFIRDLQDIGDITRKKGGMPTKAEVDAYLRDNPLGGLPSRHAASPFQPQTEEELYNRLVNTVANAAVGVTKAWTLPLSWGVSRTDPQYPEEGVVQVISSLLTVTPADRVLGEVLKISRLDKAAIKTLSTLQKMGIRGQELLRKLVRGVRTTKTEDELVEALAGTVGVSVKELRDTSGRLFTKGKLSQYRLWDNPELASMTDRVLTDMTDVIDYEHLIKKFDDMPITSKDTQMLVTAELNRILKDTRKGITMLTDMDPDLETLTRWGLLSTSEKEMVGKALKESLDNMDITHFAMGGMPQINVFKTIEKFLSESDITDYFTSTEDLINFIKVNPRGTALLLEYLNQPVEGTTISSSLISETSQPWDIETDIEKIDIDTDFLQQFDLETVTTEDQEQKIVLPIIELPDIVPITSPIEIPKIDAPTDIDIDIPPIEITEPIPIVAPTPFELEEPLPVDPIQRQVELLRRKLLREGRGQDVARETRALRTKLNKQKRKEEESHKIKPSKKLESYRVVFSYPTGASETEWVDANTFHHALNIAQRRRKIKLVPNDVLVENRSGGG